MGKAHSMTGGDAGVDAAAQVADLSALGHGKEVHDVGGQEQYEINQLAEEAKPD